jgi:hypothetical protein
LIARAEAAILTPAVRAPAWTGGDLLVTGGALVGLAATADTVRSLYERFAVDLAGLTALDRAGVALWDFRPLGAAVFATGAVAVLAGLEQPARLTRLGRAVQPSLAILLAAYATLGLVVLAFAVWIAADGSVGESDGLGFRFGQAERAMTLATQALGWVSLVVLFVVLALRTTRGAEPEPSFSEPGSVFEEMDALWRERLAFSPKREQGRTLLARIRTLEEEGDLIGARRLADEMRRL